MSKFKTHFQNFLGCSCLSIFVLAACGVMTILLVDFENWGKPTLVFLIDWGSQFSLACFFTAAILVILRAVNVSYGDGWLSKIILLVIFDSGLLMGLGGVLLMRNRIPDWLDAAMTLGSLFISIAIVYYLSYAVKVASPYDRKPYDLPQPVEFASEEWKSKANKSGSSQTTSPVNRPDPGRGTKNQKPAQTSNPHQQSKTDPSADGSLRLAERNKAFQELLQMVHGSEQTANDLIQYEKMRNPTKNELEQIKEAIRRLIHDRT